MKRRATSSRVVHVRPYLRTRDGHTEWVRKHVRAQQVVQLELSLGAATGPDRNPKHGSKASSRKPSAQQLESSRVAASAEMGDMCGGAREQDSTELFLPEEAS